MELYAVGAATIGVLALGHYKRKPRSRRSVKPLNAPALSASSIVLKQVILSGPPTRKHFKIETSEVAGRCSGDGEVLLRALVFSADPYLRGGIKSGDAPRPMAGFIAGEVVDSTSPDWAAGDFFGGHLPFTTVQRLDAATLAKTSIWKLTGLPLEVDRENISLGIGALGMPGATAYGGLIDVLRPKAGETLWVSAAGGAVGGLVGQIGEHSAA
jgi:NADPH-dependent curcumin reductase CurA